MTVNDSKGYPRFSAAAREGERGVNVVARIVSDTFGWLFKRNHQEHDFGIDGQIEVISDAGLVTGQMCAAQVKCGASFFREENQFGYVFRGELKHFNYLSNYPIPVLIILCQPNSEECFWVRFDPLQAVKTEAGWKITVPFDNRFPEAKKTLLDLFPTVQDSLADLQDYWELNHLITSAPYIHVVVSRDDIIAMDVAPTRAFFDRIRATKELALECQGKVEISFYGYENDSRELYEIDEVRAYVTLLDSALTELFFFVRTEPPTFTLKTFMLCQTEVIIVGPRPAAGKKLQVEYRTDKAGEFLKRHYLGLNEMTEWLSLPLEENKRISFAILRCLELRHEGSP